MPTPFEALDTAIGIAGSETALAGQIGISQPSIQSWRKVGSIPPERAAAIDEATQGQVRAEDLCPGYFWLRDKDGAIRSYQAPPRDVGKTGTEG